MNNLLNLDAQILTYLKYGQLVGSVIIIPMMIWLLLVWVPYFFRCFSAMRKAGKHIKFYTPSYEFGDKYELAQGLMYKSLGICISLVLGIYFTGKFILYTWGNI